MNRRKFALSLPLGMGLGMGLSLACRPVFAHGEKLASRATAFIDMMVAKHGFDRAQMERSFADLRINDRVVELLTPPTEPGRKVWWDDYRSRHLGVLNVSKGVNFAATHADTLAQAERTYGVPSLIITAILGIETRYGANTGNYSTIETLATLSFAFPPRSKYFVGELEQLFLYAREQGFDIDDLEGSYAGAMGYPQFMPTSARNWAVDMDGDGNSNLFSYADAIGSIGNFLMEHGWKRGAPVAFPVDVAADADAQKLLDAGIVPNQSARDFADAGFTVEFGAEPYGGELALIDLENEDAVEYRAGTINYYVLTRYNRSNKYAMSVFDLAAAIAQRI